MKNEFFLIFLIVFRIWKRRWQVNRQHCAPTSAIAGAGLLLPSFSMIAVRHHRNAGTVRASDKVLPTCLHRGDSSHQGRQNRIRT